MGEGMEIMEYVISMLGTRFTLSALRTCIETRVGPISVVEDAAMPSSIVGVCAWINQQYHIVLHHRLDSFHRQIVLLHELAHIALGHVSPAKPFAQHRQFDDIYPDTPAPESMYTLPEEQAAEALARMLLPHITQRVVLDDYFK